MATAIRANKSTTAHGPVSGNIIGKKHAKIELKHKAKDHLVQKTAQTQINQSAQASELITRAKKWTDESNAQKVLYRHGEHKLERTVLACENIWKLSKKLKLKRHELFDLALFRETEMYNEVKKGKIYFKKEKTGLARTIEHDPVTNRTFIHLKRHGMPALGKGWHKMVTRSILYAAHHPEIVANCVGDATVAQEGKILKRLGNCPGIARTYAVSEHTKRKTHQKVYSIILKYYNAGSVRSYEFNLAPITPYEKIYIARDLMHGLENMHNRRLAHCDLHTANFLVDRSKDPVTGKEVVSAALVDFGQTISFDAAKKRVPQVEFPHRMTTPEALLKRKHRVDVRKVEVFAMGWNFYSFFFDKLPEWAANKKLYHAKKMSTKEKKNFSAELTNDINKSIKHRHEELKTKDHILQDFGKLILEMCDPDPYKRPSAHTSRTLLDQLIKKLEGK